MRPTSYFHQQDYSRIRGRACSVFLCPSSLCADLCYINVLRSQLLNLLSKSHGWLHVAHGWLHFLSLDRQRRKRATPSFVPQYLPGVKVQRLIHPTCKNIRKPSILPNSISKTTVSHETQTTVEAQ